MRILGTDVCIEILRGNLEVIARRGRTPGPVATTWITAAELVYRACKSAAPAHNQRLVTELLATLEVFALDAAAAQAFGSLKADLERQGQRVPDADLLIAAVALTRNAVLVTGNRRHFERITTLATEDWMRGDDSYVHEPEATYDAS